MSWCKWKVWRIAYSPGNVGTQNDADGTWYPLGGPFYWLWVRTAK